MPHSNHAWIQTDYGYCTEASDLRVPPGVHPSACGLDPWGRTLPKALEHWETQRDREGDVVCWRTFATTPAGVTERLEIFND